MTELREPARWPVAAVQIGAILFVAALLASVPLDPAVWLLHTTQALIYVAVIVLARYGSIWGLGAGFTVALLWNSANLFVTGFIAAGIDALWTLLRSGHLAKPVLPLILVGAGGHFLMIVGCLAAFLRRRPGPRQWAQFFGGALLGVAALVLISPLRHHPRPLPLDIASVQALTARPAGAIVCWPKPPSGQAGRGRPA